MLELGVGHVAGREQAGDVGASIVVDLDVPARRESDQSADEFVHGMDADEDEDIDMVWRIIVEKESLEARGLTEDDFKVEVEVLSAAEIADIVDASDCVISG